MHILSKSFFTIAHRFRQRSRDDAAQVGHGEINKLSSSPTQVEGRLASNVMPALLALPSELQLVIIDELLGQDVLTLRLTCRTLYFLTEANQSSIVRRLSNLQLSHSPCRCVTPLPMTPKNPLSDLTFNGYYNMMHRGFLISRLCNIITDFVAKNVFQFRSYRVNFWRKNTPKLKASPSVADRVS